MGKGVGAVTLDLHDEEVRVTDHATGGQKGAKATRLGAIDPLALVVLGRVAGMGAAKYAAFNYLRGYDWDLSYDALQRHAMLFWSGETNDPESGLNHMAHVAWMALSLVSFSERELGNDTRYVQARRVESPYAAALRHLWEAPRPDFGLSPAVAATPEEIPDEMAQWMAAPILPPLPVHPHVVGRYPGDRQCVYTYEGQRCQARLAAIEPYVQPADNT